MESTNKNELRGVRRVLFTILTVFLLIAFITSLITVWGTVVEIKVGYKLTEVNFSYFIYEAWENITNLVKVNGYTNTEVETFVYLNLILNIIVFAIALIVVYMFAVKGFVNGIRGMITGKRTNVLKDFVVVSMAMFAYAKLSELFAVHTYGVLFMEGSSNANVSIVTGVGGAFAGTFLWIAGILSIAYVVFDKFSGKKLTSSINNVIFAVMLLLAMGLIGYYTNNAFTIEGMSTDLGLMSLLAFRYGALGITNTGIIFTQVSAYLGLLALFACIALLVILILRLYSNKKIPTLLIAILSGVTAIAALLSLVMFNPAAADIKENTLYIIKQDGIIGAFTNSVVIVVLAIVTTVLKDNEDDEDVENENVIDATPVEEN